ncbi:MAG: hemerythrin domain-containing protein [Ignavibacteriaceae bacterium]
MKRHSALHSLSHDHHQGLILAQQLKKGAPQYKGMPKTLEEKRHYTISFFDSDLKKHFSAEEEILFFFVQNKNTEIDNLISEIIGEHRKMEKLVDKIQITDELENILDELGWLLESHISKEERKLFMLIQDILSGEELKDIKNRFNKKLD